MLACSQDVFFHNNDSNGIVKYQNMQSTSTANEFQYKDKKIRHQQQRKDDLSETEDLLENSNNNIKDKEEQVWPPDVESAFIEALESIPKLGRRKILVNGKPCGRNELISDFIFRKTCKIRTRKQVSSHIQVLKNTRKGDSHFMRLLTDSVELDDNNSQTAALKSKICQPMMNNNNNNRTKTTYDSLSSDDSSINSSPSPTDYIFDIMYGDPIQQQALSMLQFKDFYDPFQQTLFSGMMNNNNSSATQFGAIVDPFFGSDVLQNEESLLLMNTLSAVTTTTTTKKPCAVTIGKKNNNTTKKRKLQHDEFALVPNYICLYLEYTLPYDPCQPLSHNLSQLPHCYPNCLPFVTLESISKEKCPPITSLSQNVSLLLLAKTKLDLNLNISDFAFNNTSFFETQTRRTIECTTIIYSFGNVVLESKEVQQALWVNEGKYMYSFVFVNQFFDAFIKGIRSLQSWDEVDIAINNLCIVQSFQDVESKYTTTPLLVMVYEFERGPGTIDISNITNEKDY